MIRDLSDSVLFVVLLLGLGWILMFEGFVIPILWVGAVDKGRDLRKS